MLIISSIETSVKWNTWSCGSVFSLTQTEGLITGTMVKMFTIAGPVIVSGTVASAVYGLVLVLLGYGG